MVVGCYRKVCLKFCFVGCGLNRVVGVYMYMTGFTSCSVSVCMKLLVRRGTSCHKGVVIVRSSNCCCGTKCIGK